MIVHWEDLELYSRKILFHNLPVLIHIKAVLTLTWLIELEGPHHRYHGLWAQHGDVKEYSTSAQGKLLDYVLSNCVLVVVSHPTVNYLLSKVLNFRLEQRLWEYSVVCYIGANPIPIHVLHELISLLGLEVFLSWCDPHGVFISVIGLLVQKTVSDHNLSWVISPVTCGMIPGWKISCGKLSSCYQVWFTKTSWLIHLDDWIFSSMVSHDI